MRGWLLLLSALLLAACSAVPVQPVDRVLVDDLHNWSMRGRLSVRDNGDSWYGSLRWKQSLEHYRIDLSGPLGQGSLRLEEAANGARLQLSTDRTYAGPDMETLLRRHLGWYLPVSGMRHWVKGLKAPGPADLVELDALGGLTTLHQDGWVITYNRYRPVGDLVLPHWVEMISGPLRVRLVIDQWDLDLAEGGAA